MQVQFKYEELLNLYLGKPIRGKAKFSSAVIRQYQSTVNKLQNAGSITDPRQRKSLDLHELKRDLVGKFAVRVNMQYRVIFSFVSEIGEPFGGPLTIIEIEDLTDYH